MRISSSLALAVALAALPVTLAQTTGDSFCSSLVCVSAVKTSTKVTYTLTRPTAAQTSDPGFGWIAMGFGSRMANSPMVIAWPNSDDNSITLSQRSAPGHVEPTQTTPSLVATLDTANSTVNTTSLASTTITFSFDDTSAPGAVPIIWAYSSRNPGSSSPGANIVQHNDAGTHTLDLTKTIDGTTSSGTPSGSGSSPTTGSLAGNQPYTRVQKVLIAHATFGGLGATVVIPLGVIIARLLRLFWPRWVRAHYMIFVIVGVPFIIVAFALGVNATNLTTTGHFFSTHRVLGLVLLIALVVQIAFGTFIHVRPASSHGKTAIKGKPLRNWLHPTLGVAILVVGWATVWTGFDEWKTWARLGDVPKAVKVMWGVLLGLFALVYLGGLSLLPRQFRRAQEHQYKQDRDSGEMALTPPSRDKEIPQSSATALVPGSSDYSQHKEGRDLQHHENGNGHANGGDHGQPAVPEHRAGNAV